MKPKEFKPFAEEWEKEMMQFTKIELIREILKPALIKNKELIELFTKMQEHVPHSHQVDFECKLCTAIIKKS